MLNLQHYKTLVFDCDGVVLDSNRLKTQAYFDVAISFGSNPQQAQAIVDHHVQFGGISRYPKFEYFLREIMQQPVTKASMKFLLDGFAEKIHQGLLHCEIAQNLQALRKSTLDARWMIVSGGDQAELRELFSQRALIEMFDGGIFGSPDNKIAILAREIASGNLLQPALFFGDSLYDHQAALSAALDFVFVSAWTEVADWKNYCEQNSIAVIERLPSA
ncbi:MAG: HAD family hydrolase [Methylophilaceae bacterium]|nr:HAD family hydrolase [Methylophilaceae bacterium]